MEGDLSRSLKFTKFRAFFPRVTEKNSSREKKKKLNILAKNFRRRQSFTSLVQLYMQTTQVEPRCRQLFKRLVQKQNDEMRNETFRTKKMFTGKHRLKVYH